jgi:hypothetical protein
MGLLSLATLCLLLFVKATPSSNTVRLWAFVPIAAAFSIAWYKKYKHGINVTKV